MDAEDRRTHWQRTYTAKGEREVSWFQDSPQPSLDLITQAAASPEAAIVDLGGGASCLADALLERGFQNITVVDLSEAALTAAKARMGEAAGRICWIAADVTTWEPPQTYDVWHDRATFHFLVEEVDRVAYLSRLRRFLKPGGHAVMATFVPDGPERCSGLPVARYDADSLARTLGPAFVPVSAQQHTHTTPWGALQQFQFSVFRHVSA
ncbi:type 12 methyltransferase [Methylobacterium sp. GXF4]|uniref:Trans-aconitate methyltransferase n=1 Tax=Methylobacterium brachiatum TaxID=269660 RepID=A0AAJ1WY94_9HYPH|nr:MULTISPECIES: class I SAM-dependent methyltransferase [Methylobacterium]EIZ81634.1 type 12 methyltransferase [Methylobacterium sp. GXF4]MCB4806296.1 class I SAM-dependent methyltransferase [Methylobacterium brachiatum]MDQ0547394.1 trans-aconitate methyltransferase [Methylobacterium brachiatum]